MKHIREKGVRYSETPACRNTSKGHDKKGRRAPSGLRDSNINLRTTDETLFGMVEEE